MTENVSHNIDNIIIATEKEADLVLKALNDIVKRYNCATVADLYDLVGLETSYIDSKWGWTFLGNIEISQIQNGYQIKLPPLEEI